MANGLRPFWFHLSIFALFVALTLLLAYVIYRLLENATSLPSNDGSRLAAAAWYGLHPANADTVNYIIASSEVISTLGVIASFGAYFAFPQLRRYYLYVLPAAIAIWQTAGCDLPGPLCDLSFAFPMDARDAPATRTLRGHRSRPAFIDLRSGIAFRASDDAAQLDRGRGQPAHDYLITQPYVTWLYFKTFFWPPASPPTTTSIRSQPQTTRASGQDSHSAFFSSPL